MKLSFQEENNILAKIIDMSGFDPLLDNLEKYVNKQGCTLGDKAKSLQKLLHCIQYCYVHGVLTESQRDSAYKKFRKQFQDALYEK
jgi:hypothetical protein